ncbi:hypothetical protein RJG79_03055 [Mycoplasmatota bacterium WC44]
MAKVKKIKVLQYAKVQTIIMAFAGLVAGILYSGLGAIYDAFTIGLNYGTALAFFAIPGMPLYFAGFGLVTGIIGAILYNATSKWFGGVEIDIKR